MERKSPQSVSENADVQSAEASGCDPGKQLGQRKGLTGNESIGLNPPTDIPEAKSIATQTSLDEDETGEDRPKASEDVTGTEPTKQHGDDKAVVSAPPATVPAVVGAEGNPPPQGEPQTVSAPPAQPANPGGVLPSAVGNLPTSDSSGSTLPAEGGAKVPDAPPNSAPPTPPAPVETPAAGMTNSNGVVSCPSVEGDANLPACPASANPPTPTIGADSGCNIERVPLKKIVIPPGRRPPDPANVADKVKSFQECGQLQPIGLTKEYCLIYGGDRKAAAEALGWTSIQAIIHDFDDLHARLAEIDENLCRRSSLVLDDALALADRKQIYLALHRETEPVTKKGGPGRRGKKTSDIVSAVSFGADTAAKTGRSVRTIERKVEIGEKLDREAAQMIRGTPVEDSLCQLKALADFPEEKQRKTAEKLKNGQIKSVRKTRPKPRTNKTNKKTNNNASIEERLRLQNAIAAVGLAKGWDADRRMQVLAELSWSNPYDEMADEIVKVGAVDHIIGQLHEHYDDAPDYLLTLLEKVAGADVAPGITVDSGLVDRVMHTLKKVTRTEDNGAYAAGGMP